MDLCWFRLHGIINYNKWFEISWKVNESCNTNEDSPYLRIKKNIPDILSIGI